MAANNQQGKRILYIQSLGTGMCKVFYSDGRIEEEMVPLKDMLENDKVKNSEGSFFKTQSYIINLSCVEQIWPAKQLIVLKLDNGTVKELSKKSEGTFIGAPTLRKMMRKVYLKDSFNLGNTEQACFFSADDILLVATKPLNYKDLVDFQDGKKHSVLYCADGRVLELFIPVKEVDRILNSRTITRSYSERCFESCIVNFDNVKFFQEGKANDSGTICMGDKTGHTYKFEVGRDVYARYKKMWDNSRVIRGGGNSGYFGFMTIEPIEHTLKGFVTMYEEGEEP